MKIKDLYEALEIEEGDAIDIKLPDGRIVGLALEPSLDYDSLPELAVYLPAIMTVNASDGGKSVAAEAKDIYIPVEKISS